jgi:hypothetical protein
MGTKKGMKRKTARKAYMPKANMGGGFTYGAGDGDTTPQKAGMNNPRVGMVDRFAKMGGTMGTTDVMDVYKKGGGTKKGMVRKTARRAYKK